MIQDGPSVDPEAMIARYDEKLKQVAADAERTDQALRQVGGSATSPDGQVTVRVNASGATADLVLRAGVRQLEPERLAQLILRTTEQAQADVSTKVVDTMREFLGEGEALEFVKSHLPQPVSGQPDEPLGRPDSRRDDDYFDNPPELIQ
jgi:DNA-binding protein YbaB